MNDFVGTSITPEVYISPRPIIVALVLIDIPIFMLVFLWSATEAFHTLQTTKSVKFFCPSDHLKVFY